MAGRLIFVLVLAGLAAGCGSPNTAAARNSLGMTYGESGHYDRAIAEFDKAIQVKPDYAEAYYNRGISYGRKGDQDKAIADFSKAIQLGHEYAQTYYSRGVAYGREGDRDRAIAHLKKCLELTSNAGLRESAQEVLSKLGAP